MPANSIEGAMPPLPEPDHSAAILDSAFRPYFSAKQMQAYAAPLIARVEELEALSERLKLEAQIHAQEAHTANATIAEIYQCVTGKTGEPGNWNGAEPVRTRLVELEAALIGVLRHFPTDTDLMEAGWASKDINDACDAYELGKAAIAARKEQQHEHP